ncbi:hypothetical protein [Roseibium sediminicola]|uniref:Uncharacterized protein n=1 Tax=Roseibium sediminicola TaxID=2933272 RepID=A0ABT0GRF2_9HYPH|nr:hypothetical protein [Roseibium sp. CAU 1639]MCK7611622.1 hypothetical protein [Roseibium sp. CAU 1639]
MNKIAAVSTMRARRSASLSFRAGCFDSFSGMRVFQAFSLRLRPAVPVGAVTGIADAPAFVISGSITSCNSKPCHQIKNERSFVNFMTHYDIPRT